LSEVGPLKTVKLSINGPRLDTTLCTKSQETLYHPTMHTYCYPLLQCLKYGQR